MRSENPVWEKGYSGLQMGAKNRTETDQEGAERGCSTGNSSRQTVLAILKHP